MLDHRKFADKLHSWQPSICKYKDSIWLWNKTAICIFSPSQRQRQTVHMNKWLAVVVRSVLRWKISKSCEWTRMYQTVAYIFFYLIITLHCRNSHYYSTFKFRAFVQTTGKKWIIIWSLSEIKAMDFLINHSWINSTNINI